MGRTNKKHSKKLVGYRCPVCKNFLEVCNHGDDWWVACYGDVLRYNTPPNHIPQMLFNSAKDAIKAWTDSHEPL